MDPFVQAARRFSARRAMFWKLAKRPVLRAVAPPSQTEDLLQFLRWEEAQPECHRPLVVIKDAFTGAPAYFEIVTRRILEAFATLQAAALEAGVVLPDVLRAISAEPLVAAVQTAERVSGALPQALEGLTIALVPARVQELGEWAAQVGGLVKAVTALSTTGPNGQRRRVHWMVHEWPGGPLAAVLGSGVELALDEGALFAWWRDAGRSRLPDAPAVPPEPEHGRAVRRGRRSRLIFFERSAWEPEKMEEEDSGASPRPAPPARRPLATKELRTCPVLSKTRSRTRW
jgi:hypothetical protein